MGITVLLKKVGQKPVVFEREPGLKASQALVGGLIQEIAIHGTDLILVCNEEGTLLWLPLNFYWFGGSPIVGDVFVTKYGNKGEYEDLTLEDVMLATKVLGWTNHPSGVGR